MARKQIDDHHEDLSKLLEEANKEAFSEKTPIDEKTLSILDEMNADSLRKLIRRVSGAMWSVGIKSKNEIAEAFKLKLAIGGLTEKDMFKALPVMREWFDRELGKAAQSVALTVDDNSLDKLSTERLLRLAAMLDDPVIIAPMPKADSASEATT